jgi:hypothetical protein
MPARILGNVTSASVSQIKPRVSVSVVDPVVGAQATIAAADVAYIFMRPSAFLDTTGQFKYIPELVVVSDAVALAVSKSFTDGVSAAVDAVTRDTTKGLADSISFTEVFVATLVFIRDFTDTASVDDARTMAFAKALTDSFALSETATRLFTKSLTSGVEMEDGFDATDGVVHSFTKGISNVVFAQEALTKVFTKDLSDTPAVTDAIALTFAKALASAAVIADALATDVDKGLTDSFTPNDALALLISKLVDPDSVSIADATALSPQKAISDMIEPVDAGSLISQGYCDITYFAEDYVGESRTFT